MPAVSCLDLTVGGLLYTACPFNGWYSVTEIVHNMVSGWGPPPAPAEGPGAKLDGGGREGRAGPVPEHEGDPLQVLGAGGRSDGAGKGLYSGGRGTLCGDWRCLDMTQVVRRGHEGDCCRPPPPRLCPPPPPSSPLSVLFLAQMHEDRYNVGLEVARNLGLESRNDYDVGAPPPVADCCCCSVHAAWASLIVGAWPCALPCPLSVRCRFS